MNFRVNSSEMALSGHSAAMWRGKKRFTNQRHQWTIYRSRHTWLCDFDWGTVASRKLLTHRVVVTQNYT